MPRTMTTDWEIIATSGKTVDGRNIEKVWLTDMAETYNPNVYSSKIYLDHERWFGAQGKVVELKVEPATDPQLKGEIHLFAKLCPSDDLVYANRRGRYVHSSIEVLKNFRGTGKFYLGGMAVTDEPASVGTSELHFKEKDDRLFISGHELSFPSEADDSEPEVDGRIRCFFKNLLKTDKGESQDIPMDKEQFEKFSSTQNKTNELLETLIGKFATEKPDDDGKEKPTDGKAKGEGDFVSKKDHDELLEKFASLETKITDALKTPVTGTQFTENLGDVEPEI